MNVTLIRRTDCPESLCADAAAVCVGKTEGTPEGLSRALESGHESLLEHASFTFLVTGVSRALLAQLTRHRHASFSVESQRYVPYSEGFGYVTPGRIKVLGEETVSRYTAQMEFMTRWYAGWLNSLGRSGAEDARFVLPNACTTRLMMTMNARELKHFFALRLCSRAQWEIRELAEKMLELVRPHMPSVFKEHMAACDQTGYCRETRSCGRAPRLKDLLATHSEGLNALRDEVYQDAEAHGLWEKASHVTPMEPFMRYLAAQRIAEEVKEAMEAASDPEHFSEELADVIITALSAAGLMDIDIDKAVKDKMAINKKRPYKHLEVG